MLHIYYSSVIIKITHTRRMPTWHTPAIMHAFWIILPPSGITLHSVFSQSQTFQILTKYIGKTFNNYETKYMQYENIFYDNSNDGYFIL
jgi:hypothetical protein